MITRRAAVSILSLVVACTLLAGCATKKYVKEQVATSKTELSGRLDQQGNEQKTLSGQVQEISQLSKQNSAKIDQLQGNLNTSVASLDQKTDDAKKTATDARGVADTALSTAKDASTGLANRNNYQVQDSKDVLFKSGSYRLDDASKATLDEVAGTLSGNKNNVLELLGYTDSVGDPNANVRLSERRVDTVTRYLVEHKVDLFRIYQLGLGQADPVDSNKTRAGRAKNRRVTIRILAPK